MPAISIAPATRVLFSIPTLDTAAGLTDRTAEILAALTPAPARVVYLSTTGVYGRTRQVDENTPMDPVTPREILRAAAENAVSGGPWSSLILRPAAIYGPGRGIHVSMAAGQFRFAGDGSNFVSRIHVDDLAHLSEAALLSDLPDAWPVADDHPCTSREIAEFCSQLLGVPLPSSAGTDALHPTRTADRLVDGRAVRRLLGVELRYPSYRVGIPASL
jgi:nucleoside-diphosphate-sugar epimerase